MVSEPAKLVVPRSDLALKSVRSGDSAQQFIESAAAARNPKNRREGHSAQEGGKRNDLQQLVVSRLEDDLQPAAGQEDGNQAQ